MAGVKGVMRDAADKARETNRRLDDLRVYYKGL